MTDRTETRILCSKNVPAPCPNAAVEILYTREAYSPQWEIYPRCSEHPAADDVHLIKMMSPLAETRIEPLAQPAPERPTPEDFAEAKVTGRCPVHGRRLEYDPDPEVQASGGPYEEHDVCPVEGCKVGAWYG